MENILFWGKNKRYLKYLNFFSAFLALLFISCASTPQANVLGLQDLSVSSLDETDVKQNGVVNEHLSPEEMKSLNVYIFDSDNCKQTAERLSSLTRDDLSYEDAVSEQNNLLKKYFQNGRFDFKEEEDVSYDLIIMRDFVLKVGARSGNTTEIDLTLYFIYPASDFPSLKKETAYILRGQSDMVGKSKVPYPAFNTGTKNAHLNLIKNMDEILSKGIDLCTFSDGDIVQDAVAKPSVSVAPAGFEPVKGKPKALRKLLNK